MKTISCSYFQWIFLLFFFTWGCEENRWNDMEPDKVYLAKPGLQEVNVYNWGTDSIPVYVIKSGIGQQNVQLKIEVDPTLLHKYNRTLSEPYELLGDQVYSLVSTTVKMNADDYRASFSFLLNTEALATALAAGKKLALPCRVYVVGASIEKADEPVMETLLVPNLKEPYIRFDFPGIQENTVQVKADQTDGFWIYSKVSTNYTISNQLPFEVVVDEDFVHQYNEENGTNLVPMPASAVDMSSTDWFIPAKGTVRQIACKLLANRLVKPDGSPAYGEYWMPLRLASVAANKINPNAEIQIFRIEYTEN
ncbi:DUF1735 domain-containing protein [Parapedobacter defluvii]|nr:DUF1735 domain-containing protein [Parapedobacter defluvii]